MKTTDFNQSITAEQLNENMFKQFGSRIEFDKYTREELENYRNLLRTKVDQHEKSSKFNDLLTNETYQKDKYMLGVLNTKIKEMLGESVLSEKAVSKAQQKFMGMVHAAQKGEKPASPAVAKAAKGMSKKAAKDYASTKHKGLPAHKVDEASAEFKQDLKKRVAVNKADKYEKMADTRDKIGSETSDTYRKMSAAQRKMAKEGIKETIMKTTEAKMKKAKKDYDGDGKVETEKDEVWGSRMKAAKKAGNMKEGVGQEGIDDLLAAVEEEIRQPGMHTDNLVDVLNATHGVSSHPVVRKARAVIGNYIEQVESGTDIREYDLTDLLQHAAAYLDQAIAGEGIGEGFEDKVAAAREKAAAKGKTEKPDYGKAAPVARTVKGSKYGGSKQKDKEEDLDEYFDYGEPKTKSKNTRAPGHDELARREKTFANMGNLSDKNMGSEYKQKDDPRYRGMYKIAGPHGKLPEEACMKTKKSKKVAESSMKSHYKMIIEGLQQFIAEDEEGKAKDITAGTDMVNDFTSWMQRIGQYQTKSMIELSDSIRANFGQAEADAFKNAIQPALAEALASLTQARETITRAVATLAGEENAEPMGAMPGEEPLDLEASPDLMNTPDEFGAADAAAGGEEVAGRELRESRRVQKIRKITESHSILSKLAR